MVIVFCTGKIPLAEFVTPDLIHAVMTVGSALHARPCAETPRYVSIGIHYGILYRHVVTALPFERFVKD